MKKRDFLAVFKNIKPIIGMLHLKGDDSEEVFERFKKELDIYINSGIDGVMVENYYGNYDDLKRALEYIKSNNINIPYGVNCLNIDYMGFYLARKFDCDYIQLDSVVGHVKPRDEFTLKAFFDLMKEEYKGYVLGGVRFKYQPVLSEKSLKEDLEIAKTRCDAVCVTQDRTGEETSLERIIEFKKELQDFPLIVAAGVTNDNAKKQLEYADGAIIGSYFKDNFEDNGELCLEHIEELLKTVREIRGETK